MDSIGHATVGGTVGILLFKDTFDSSFWRGKCCVFLAGIGAVIGSLPDIDIVNKWFH